eukprot:m.33609 g.33609  ORF g.33609 m.33609 type:complete len:98 (+) comp9648_c0_seq1:258-551(+)
MHTNPSDPTREAAQNGLAVHAHVFNQCMHWSALTFALSQWAFQAVDRDLRCNYANVFAGLANCTQGVVKQTTLTNKQAMQRNPWLHSMQVHKPRLHM